MGGGGGGGGTYNSPNNFFSAGILNKNVHFLTRVIETQEYRWILPMQLYPDDV